MKNCTRCHAEKPEDSFHLLRNGKRYSWCRACTSAYRTRQRDEPRACRKCGNLFAPRKWQVKGKGVYCSRACAGNAMKRDRPAPKPRQPGMTPMEAKRLYRLRHRERVNAHEAVRKAKLDGRLVPAPCETCGASAERVQAHHDDYSRPLSVRWLCKKCHTAWHWKKAVQV